MGNPNDPITIHPNTCKEFPYIINKKNIMQRGS
jgi:hypothetical protein